MSNNAFRVLALLADEIDGAERRYGRKSIAYFRAVAAYQYAVAKLAA